MNRLQYKKVSQTRPRTTIGRALPITQGLVSSSSGTTYEIIKHATKSITAFSIDADTREDYQLAGGVLRVFTSKARFRVRERHKSAAGKLGKVNATIQGSFKRHTVLLTALVQGAMDYATVESKEVCELVSDDGTRYPLRVPIDIAKRLIGRSLRFSFMQSETLSRLTGEDTDEQTALANFASGFHRLVNTHWKKPPHLHTTEDEKMNRVLDHLVDWDRYREVNPIEQPLWGRVVESLDNGDIRVHWVIGPNENRGDTTVVRSKDVCSALRAIPTDNWFYGSGKVYPTRIEWIDQPVEVPDPHNRDAIREAWDLIPRHVISEADAWPLKHKE